MVAHRGEVWWADLGKITGLSRDSVALVCQVITADKTWLSDLVGALPRAAQRKLDSGLKLALSLA